MGARDIVNFGGILRAALTLAQAGSVTTVALATTQLITTKIARKRLNDYTARGYLVRLKAGVDGCGAHGATVYGITEAGRDKLTALDKLRASVAVTPTGANFGPLLAAFRGGR